MVPVNCVEDSSRKQTGCIDHLKQTEIAQPTLQKQILKQKKKLGKSCESTFQHLVFFSTPRIANVNEPTLLEKNV